MSLLEARLKKLQKLINYPNEYINIIYGNGWEVAIYSNNQAKVIGVHPTSLSEAVRKVLLQLEIMEVHE